MKTSNTSEGNPIGQERHGRTYDDIRERNGSKTAVPKDISEMSGNVVQVLSQRLENMEQQLVLLRDDLRNAISSSKQKDQKISSLNNKIALAKSHRDKEKSKANGNDTYEPSNAEVGWKTLAERKALEEECRKLANKLQEMEKFFGDYGLAWVEEEALGRDPNDLWVRKTNVHYTPNFDKLFLVVEELNIGNMGPQVARKGNKAQFKMADVLNLTLYADGIQLENNPFRPYESPSVEEFFNDLEDGYFPTELKAGHPEGVIFKVKDKRDLIFVDDREKKSAFERGQQLSQHTYGTSYPSRDEPPSSTLTRNKSAVATAVEDCINDRMNKDDNDKFISSLPKTHEASEIGGMLTEKTTSEPLGPHRTEKEVETPSLIPEVETQNVINESPSDGTTNKLDKATSVNEVPSDNSGTSTGFQWRSESERRFTADQLAERGFEARKTTDLVEKSAMESKKKKEHRTPPLPAVPQAQHQLEELSELFQGRSPNASYLRVPKEEFYGGMRVYEGELSGHDNFGQPKSPHSSLSSVHPRHSMSKGSTLKQFDGYVTSKIKHTQTSPKFIPNSATPPPATHDTDIKCIETPIPLQFTPSEVVTIKQQLSTIEKNKCSTCHPLTTTHCQCSPDSKGESNPRAFDQSKWENKRKSVMKITGSTEYRDRYTDSAVNNANISHVENSLEIETSSSPPPPTRTPAATDLVEPDVASIPPDPKHYDPYEKWEHFTYLGHSKSQKDIVIPAQPQELRYEKAVIELNKKTSDSMIAVRMTTRSGIKEYKAYVNPEEPVKKLWSLLKLDDDKYSLRKVKTPSVSKEKGSTANLSNNDDLTLIISKNEINENDELPVKGISRSINIDGAETLTEGSKVASLSFKAITNSRSLLEDHTGKKDEFRHSDTVGLHQRSENSSNSTEKRMSQSAGSSGAGSKFVHSSRSVYSRSPNIDGPRITMEELATASTQLCFASEGTRRIDTSKNLKMGLSQVEQSLRKSLMKEVTPTTRAESLSKHLSGSSFHRSSTRGSFRKLDVIGDTTDFGEGKATYQVADGNGTASSVQGGKEKPSTLSTISAEILKDTVPRQYSYISGAKGYPLPGTQQIVSGVSSKDWGKESGGPRTVFEKRRVTLTSGERSNTTLKRKQSDASDDCRTKLSREPSITTLKKRQSAGSEYQDTNQAELSREVSITTLKRKCNLLSEENTGRVLVQRMTERENIVMKNLNLESDKRPSGRGSFENQ